MFHLINASKVSPYKKRNALEFLPDEKHPFRVTKVSIIAALMSFKMQRYGCSDLCSDFFCAALCLSHCFSAAFFLKTLNF